MIIEWQQWRIRSTDLCFQVERKINPTRWVVESYHNTLAQACHSLLHYRIRTETAKYVIDAADASSARLSTAKLIKKIDAITQEIFQGIHHDL